ncbi:MAG: hypothetical protein IT383_06600 [Deltaproteobacteria bacterium]|nr:hypothetical protein [Deltaproteobacteria bacterium]
MIAHLLLVTLTLPAAEPAYRLGSATNRLALLPVQCERDLEPALCRAVGESLAVDIAREPRLEVVTPQDLDVLLGAQAIAELSSCDKDDCYSGHDFTRIDAAYLVALGINRIGHEARLVARIVDLKRGAVIDRDNAAAPATDERAIERAARALVMGLLVRRGLARAPDDDAEERGVSPVFWAGAITGGAGVIAAAGAGALGVNVLLQTDQLRADAAHLDPAGFDAAARDIRTQAYGADLLLVGAAALAVAGGAMMVVGAL